MLYLHLLLVLSITLANTLQAESALATTDGKPTSQLQKLFAYLKVKHDGTLVDMARKAQQLWPGVPSDYTYMNHMLPDVEPIIQKLGLIGEINTLRLSSYKHVIVVGGFVGAVKGRLRYLKKLWDQGIRFEKITLLSCQRPLYPQWDSVTELCTDNIPGLPIKPGWHFDHHAPYATEDDMFKMVYQQLDLAQVFKDVPIEFVTTTVGSLGDNGEVYFSTPDKLNAWLATNPTPGSCLAITNQPYVAIFNAILHKYVPSTFGIIDVVGYAIHPRYHSVSMWLGAVAQLLEKEVLNEFATSL